jgi:hypothetical protein
VNLVVRLQRIRTITGGGIARPADFLGLNLVDNILLRFGTERVQTVRMPELFYKVMLLMSDEQRACARQLLRGGIVPLVRQQNSVAGTVLATLPLWTLLGIHLGGDPSQILPVRSLNERLRLVVTFSDADKIMESDNTYDFVGGSVVAQPPAASLFFADSYLYVEGKHIANREREAHAAASRAPHLMLFREHQYVEHRRVPAATPLTGGFFDVEMGEITQPVVALYIMLRWADDLDRVDGGAGGGRGRNLWNVGGWMNPGGATDNTGLPIVKFIEGRAGSNLLWLQKTEVEHLLDYERLRAFQGSGLQGGGPAIPAISFSHDPSANNACLGFVDFSQSDRPKLRLYWNEEHGSATVGAAANVDIGSVSDLDVLIVADTISQISVANAQLVRPIN